MVMLKNVEQREGSAANSEKTKSYSSFRRNSRIFVFDRNLSKSIANTRSWLTVGSTCIHNKSLFEIQITKDRTKARSHYAHKIIVIYLPAHSRKVVHPLLHELHTSLNFRLLLHIHTWI